MRLLSLFERYNLASVKLNLRFAEATFTPTDADAHAAWDLYVEMLTRVVTQPLPLDRGDEKAALDSVHSLFPTTRAILRDYGRQAIGFAKIAIPVLNQVVRPFTARWHREALAGAFENPTKRQKFRDELGILQANLQDYTRLLAEIADVEDLTDLEGLSHRDGGDSV